MGRGKGSGTGAETSKLLDSRFIPVYFLILVVGPIQYAFPLTNDQGLASSLRLDDHINIMQRVSVNDKFITSSLSRHANAV